MVRGAQAQKARTGVSDETGGGGRAGLAGHAKIFNSILRIMENHRRFMRGEAAIQPVSRRALPAVRRTDWGRTDSRQLG